MITVHYYESETWKKDHSIKSNLYASNRKEEKIDIPGDPEWAKNEVIVIYLILTNW